MVWKTKEFQLTGASSNSNCSITASFYSNDFQISWRPKIQSIQLVEVKNSPDLNAQTMYFNGFLSLNENQFLATKGTIYFSLDSAENCKSATVASEQHLVWETWTRPADSIFNSAANLLISVIYLGFCCSVNWAMIRGDAIVLCFILKVSKGQLR